MAKASVVAQASRPVASTSRSTFLAFFLLVPSLSAADLTGTWIGVIPSDSPRRPAQDLAFQLVQQGTQLSGKQYNDEMSSPVQGGVVEDGRIHFTVTLREQAGNQVNDVVYEFDGTLDGDSLQISRERASARDAVSGSPVPVRRPDDDDAADHKRRFHDFRLEKLF